MSTQDGYDWPNNVQDERWPADKYQPAAPYFREQLVPDDAQWLEQTRREMREVAEIACEPPNLRKWRCATCWDTGVIRHPPMLGDEWNSRVERCPSPVHKEAMRDSCIVGPETTIVVNAADRDGMREFRARHGYAV